LLVFGHTGITLGVTLALGSPPSKIKTFVKRLDLRLLLLGSLLPDIIDKPLGHIFLRETLNNGRIFSHTMFFLLVISLAGYLLYRRGQLWLLTLAIGIFWHLVLDQMWLNPQTLLWPAFGFGFEKLAIDNLVSQLLYDLLREPEVYVPEIAGVLVLTWFGLKLLWQKSLLSFLKTGQDNIHRA
jgi:hypothetical protein